MILRNWEDICVAFNIKGMRSVGNLEGAIMFDLILDEPPKITKRRFYKNDDKKEFISFPFTRDELLDFLKGKNHE